MVIDRLSAKRIRSYLHRWILWWVRTTDYAWRYEDVLKWFLAVCWDGDVAAYADSLRAPAKPIEQHTFPPARHQVFEAALVVAV